MILLLRHGKSLFFFPKRWGFFSRRGVLQALVEKHFPAPDRQKLYSLLGIDLSAKKTPSPNDLPAAKTEQKGKKRKGQSLLTLVPNRCKAVNWPFGLYFRNFQVLMLRSSRRRKPASMAACRVPAQTRAWRRTRTKSPIKTVTTASNLSALPMRTMISIHSKMSLMMMKKMVSVWAILN